MKLLPLLAAVLAYGCATHNSGEAPISTTINNLNDIPSGTSLAAFKTQADKLGCQQVWNSGSLGNEKIVFSCKPGGNYLTFWDAGMKLKRVEKVVK